MHELSIAESIVSIADRQADGRRVTKVRVKVGHLRQVVPSALSFGFELVSGGTSVEAAELDLEEVPATGWCARCEVQTRLRSFPLLCRSCGESNLEILTGEELFVEYLELEEMEEA